MESFDFRVRDAAPSVEAFDSVLGAQTVITDWGTFDNLLLLAATRQSRPETAGGRGPCRSTDQAQNGGIRMPDQSSVVAAATDGGATAHVLFIQGAGRGAYEEDARLADSLRRALGPRVAVRYPAMPNEDDAPYEQWRQRIERELADLPGPAAVVGHSVGASVLLKWLSEREDGTANTLAGVFLVAGPFWGGDGWRYDGYEELALRPGFAARLPPGLPVFLYHCRDDATVPFAHLALYARALPQATVRAVDSGGHQFDDDLAAVAEDILSLP